MDHLALLDHPIFSFELYYYCGVWLPVLRRVSQERILSSNWFHRKMMTMMNLVLHRRVDKNYFFGAFDGGRGEEQQSGPMRISFRRSLHILVGLTIPCEHDR